MAAGHGVVADDVIAAVQEVAGDGLQAEVHVAAQGEFLPGGEVEGAPGGKRSAAVAASVTQVEKSAEGPSVVGDVTGQDDGMAGYVGDLLVVSEAVGRLVQGFLPAVTGIQR